ncbi:ATP-grasp domain-containing protein [uncultured Endozoicomonas sp.]|uniref:ATP-grasp domain-containing protein n=1 Tax=uncultured Endozoicomonas sp. TaxID=432652 RepID=UPI002632233F|nr:ATP-grasp domain-containing protein [uncultured Endozoicomonas sp.]
MDTSFHSHQPSDQALFIERTAQGKPVHPGMPKLEPVKKTISFFEFWPGYLFYIPVAIQWLWLAIRYRGVGLPLIANPSIPLSGMVGESKADIFSQATGEAKEKIANWVLLENWQNAKEGAERASDLILENGLDYPLVAKPDIGCRGAGVQLIRSQDELRAYIASFPKNGRIVFQQLVPYEAEAGVFYIRYPGEKKGRIISITLKYSPYVIGNGKQTLEELIENDPRAGQLKHLYLPRHADRLQDVLPAGQPFRLAFTGSHSRGCIFRDGRQYISSEMTQSFDSVCDGLTEFHYGRFDIRFKDIESLMKGKDYFILEVNGASSEAAHIWDCRGSLTEAFRTLFFQYRTLFKLGAINRKRGFSAQPLRQLVQSWWREKALVKRYPSTE